MIRGLCPLPGQAGRSDNTVEPSLQLALILLIASRLLLLSGAWSTWLAFAVELLED